VANVRECVLDGYPFAQLGAPGGGVLALAQLGQQALVGIEPAPVWWRPQHLVLTE
jgi:hypothetical protein